MEKFSVKKPFTVLVAVIMVLMLGFVSITKMKTNLLPDVSTPYLMVVTVYPGASPERVETEVSDAAKCAYGARCFKDHRHLGRKLQPAADAVRG
ncbi:MAG: efflux RND transporter permease subunit [Faecalibacterium prausnitzii]